MNIAPIAQRIDWLRQHQVLPPDGEFPELAERLRAHGDLTPLLLEAWVRSLDESRSRRQRRHAERVAAWLETRVASHAELSWGVPGDRCQRVREWIGERLVWWPGGIPQGQRVGVVSSRLGRFLENQRTWFAALRGTCELVRAKCAVMIAAEKTTTCRFLERCSELFQIPLLRFELPGSRRTVARWFRSRLSAPLQENVSSELIWPASISPALDSEPVCGAPVRDRLVTAASDQVVVLRMRSRGHVERLVRRRLREESAESRAAISLAVGPELVPADLAGTLPGAKRLRLDIQLARNEITRPRNVTDGAGPILSLNRFSATRYLTHCTRRAAGPWPDQSAEGYRDALILGREEADHNALATLVRIATQRRLLATGQAIRGGTHVVCFTAVALDQLKDLRTFRLHRGRWDFEPYGICIEKEWLEQRGTRAVRYGDESLWEQLTESERAFFQRRWAGSQNQLDWSLEREWRHVGDVDLADLPPDAGLLFVPTVAEARWLGARSRWPVVVLD